MRRSFIVLTSVMDLRSRVCWVFMWWSIIDLTQVFLLVYLYIWVFLFPWLTGWFFYFFCFHFHSGESFWGDLILFQQKLFGVIFFWEEAVGVSGTAFDKFKLREICYAQGQAVIETGCEWQFISKVIFFLLFLWVGLCFRLAVGMTLAPSSWQ